MSDNAHLPIAHPAEFRDVSPARRLLDAFLAGRSATTLRCYAGDLRDFAGFLGVNTPEAVAERLLAGGPGLANELALQYKAHLITRGLAAATVNRRLAALRSLVKLARTLGLVNWTLEVEGMQAEAYRETRGPGRTGFRQLLEQLAGRTDPKALRDRAILRLLFDLGLRRAEVCGLDVGDIDRAAGVLWILGKGRTQKERLTIPAPTLAALEAWLAMRGEAIGPLFTCLDRARKESGRLTGAAVYQLVRCLGERSGIRARPHGLRHAAITEALDLTRGDVRAVQRFSRHKNLQTVLRYDDNRLDLAGDIARRVAEASQGEAEVPLAGTTPRW
jgi:integrase/recombinase XerC